jgi:hypothetical protein
MRTRVLAISVAGVCALHAPLLSAQIAAEPAPQASFASAALIIGAVVAIGIAVWLFWRANRQGRRGTRPSAPAAEPAHLDAFAAAPASSHSSGRRTIFISYRRTDSADITGRIYDRLIDRFGKEHVYKDVDSVPLGVDFRKHVGDLVQRCDAVIAIIGGQWVTVQSGDARRLDDPRDLVRIEIASALARGIPVVPVLVGGAAMPTEQDLPQEIHALAYRNGISVRPDPDFHKDLDRLIAGIDAHFGAN